MEETKVNKKSEQKIYNEASLSIELQKINEIEKSISDMKSHIRFLLNREASEDKKTKSVFQEGVKKTGSKINLVTTHLREKSKVEQSLKEKDMKTQRVKQFREKQSALLRQTRLQISKFKENQRTEIRELSKRNDQAIKQSKIMETKRNKERAENRRNDHNKRMEDLNLQKLLERKKKEQIQLQQNLSKISQKPTLEQQMQTLRKYQKELNARLEQKKQLQKIIKETTRKISKMEESSLLQQIQKSQTSSPRQKSRQNQQKPQKKQAREDAIKQIQKKLIRDALKMKESKKQNSKNSKKDHKLDTSVIFIR